MKLPPGVFKATKKDGTLYFRASLTYHGKHISLGSSPDLRYAAMLYEEASSLLQSDDSVENYSSYEYVPFDKYISLINFRDNEVYFKNPIYLYQRYFSYFLDKDTELKFDTDDLFFYSQHRIQRRGGHFFTENYGAQISLGFRYGIHPFAVSGKDYRFKNGDDTDFRYENIEIINRYLGVETVADTYPPKYRAYIHVNGYYNLGIFDSEEKAAIAFNKARDMLKETGIKKATPANYIQDMHEDRYYEIYSMIKLPGKFMRYVKSAL